MSVLYFHRPQRGAAGNQGSNHNRGNTHWISKNKKLKYCSDNPQAPGKCNMIPRSPDNDYRTLVDCLQETRTL